MVELQNVTKKYGTFTAVEHIHCVFNEGSIYGLVGYNGAGKTTLLKTACGIFKPEQGTVTLDGVPVYDNADAKSRLFIIPDELYILPQASMRRMAAFYRGYYPRWNDTLFRKLADIFKLDTHKRIHGFSKGMQRQAFIILALSAMPDYLFLDEAFDGIDPMMRDLVRQLLLEAIAERNMGIVLSSHNLRELEDLCDRVGVINGKRIVYDADVNDMRINKNKYKVIFNGDFNEHALLSGLDVPCRNSKREGPVLTFIADGPVEEVTQKLTAHHPLLLETLPLTLEEIFLIEMEAQTYDFTDLFR